MKTPKFNPKKGKAQAIVEFAIVLPILLLVVYGLIETGRLLFIYSSVNNATRQAARYGSTSGVGPNGVPRFQDCAGIRAAAQRSDFLNAFDDVDIIITYDRPTSGNPDPGDYDTCDGTTDSSVNSQTGDRVNVVISADYDTIVPNLVPFIARTVANGNPIVAESSRTLLLTIDIEPPKENTVTLITSDAPDASEIGQYVTVSVTVTAETTPTGAVTITGADENCNITLTNGSGSCVVRFTAVGDRTVTASYLGDDNHNPSSDTEAHTVIRATTQTTITSDFPDPSISNQTANVAVSVTSAWGTPGGTVEITGADSNCTIDLSVTNNCDVTFTSPGPKLLTANYLGDSEHQPSDDTETHNVLPPGLSVTNITSDNPDSSVAGQAVTVNVTVTGSVTPTGTVTVSSAGLTCSIVLSNGSGSCTLTFPSNGSYTITADYPGDANNQGSSDTEAHTVEFPATVTQISFPGGNSSVAGQPVTVNVSVTGGSTPPTGTVTVTTPFGTFCTITLPATSCTGTFNVAGNVTLTASYSGDSAHAPSSGTANYSVSVAGCTAASFVLSRIHQPGDLTMTMDITNNLPVAIQFSSISVTWNDDKGHKTGGDDKTLILQGASLGIFTWTGNQPVSPYTIVAASPAYIPSGASTLVFTFQQAFERWDDTEQVTINLSTPGCTGVILFQNQHD